MRHPALLQADWPAPAGVHGFTTLRHGAGVSTPPFDTFNLGLRCGDALDAAMANRDELSRIGGLPSSPAWLQQVHGVGVVRVSEGPRTKGTPPQPVRPSGAAFGRSSDREPLVRDRSSSPPAVAGEGAGHLEPAIDAEPEADAAVTSTPGTVLAILTADCLPVLLCSRDGDEIGAAHAGWRGLAAGVLEATVAAMRTPADRLMAWLGPAAGPDDYEIGVEVYDAFVSRDWRAGAAFASTRPNHWRVDLYALARMRLQHAGIEPDAIHGGGISTIGEPDRFFSHRRDARTGRMATLAWSE